MSSLLHVTWNNPDITALSFLSLTTTHLFLTRQKANQIAFPFARWGN